MSDHKPLESVFKLLHGMKRHLHKQAELLDLGIAPMHIRVIKIIDRKKPCTAVDIADFLGRDKAQVTRLVNALIEKELITKEPNLNDKRSCYLHTSDAGNQIVEEIKIIDAKTVQVMNRGLKAEEVSEFQRVSKLMTQNLNSYKG